MMKYDMKACGKRIQQLRIRHKYSQQQLANELNINRSYLSRIESGINGCSIDLFVRLSDLFDISLDWLILGREHLGAWGEKEQLISHVDHLISQLEEFKKSLKT